MPKTPVPAAAALIAGLSNAAWAQEPDPLDQPGAVAPRNGVQEVPEPANEAGDGGERWSFAGGSDVVTEYISRGVLFAKEVSLQPGVTLSADLPELEGGAVTGASAFVGVWGSIKLGSIPENSSSGLDRFYESDLYAGVAVQVANEWNVSATYYRYESLSDSFEGYDDFELIVGYDDTGVWDGVIGLRNFRLSPSLRMVQESGRPGRRDALYVQPSITPSFDARLLGADVRIAVPVMVGLSDYYYDSTEGGFETFGYFRTGLIISTSPAPNSLPGLRLSSGVDLWIPNREAVTGLNRYDAVGRIGLSWSL